MGHLALAATRRRSGQRYFETLGEAARSGLFDILAHPDLVKVWGERVPRPEGDLRRFYERAMDGIADSDVAIEVSTAGLRKPVAEIYPAAGFLELCLEAGRPVALSSDAHVPDQLGYEYERAVEWLRGLGVTRARGVRGAQPPAGAARVTARSGIGFDSHRFEEGRRLVLGGVEVPYVARPRGALGRRRARPRGHRRAARRGRPRGHRLALPGHGRALARRGQHRPPRRARGLLGEQGLAPVNVDAVVLCEAPKLGPFRDAMRERLAEALGLRASHVSVKFTTGEGMGFIGRGEGIAALATATVAPHGSG